MCLVNKQVGKSSSEWLELYHSTNTGKNVCLAVYQERVPAYIVLLPSRDLWRELKSTYLHIHTSRVLTLLANDKLVYLKFGHGLRGFKITQWMSVERNSVCIIFPSSVLKTKVLIFNVDSAMMEFNYVFIGKGIATMLTKYYLKKILSWKFLIFPQLPSRILYFAWLDQFVEYTTRFPDGSMFSQCAVTDTVECSRGSHYWRRSYQWTKSFASSIEENWTGWIVFV